MTVVQALTAFTVAATLLTITPGLDTALVLRSVAAGGARAGVRAGLGIACGCLVWGFAVAVGLTALLATAPLAFRLLQWVGAAYLLWLGVGLIANPRRAVALDDSAIGQRAFVRGWLTNMLNPKVGIFYLTFLVQFVPPGVVVGGFVFMLACIHAALGLAWFAVLIAAVVPLSRWLRRPRVVAWLDRVTGGVFILFGARLALARQA